jgi:WD40 repeat protein
VDLSPDESVIATGSYDGRICLWTQDGGCRCVFRAPHLVNLVRFSPAGTELACAAADNKAYVVDVESGALLAVAGPFGDDVNAAVWRPRHRQIAIVTDTFDPVVRLWDLERDEQLATFVGHTDCVCGAAFDGDGGRMATAGEDGTARIWELGEDRCVAVLEHPNDPESIDWSPDSRFIVTGCNDGVLRLYDGADYSLICTSEAADAAVRLVRFTPDGRSVLAGSYDAHLRCLSLPDLEVQATFRSPWQWERSAVAGRSKTVVGSFGSGPVVYDRAGAMLADGGRTYGINALDADRGDGRLRVFVGRDDGIVAEGLSSTAIARHDSIVNGVALSPDGSLLASCDYRGSIVVSMPDGTPVTQLHPGGTGPLNTIVWLDADNLLTAGYSGELLRCTLSSGAIARTAAHSGPIKALCLDESTGVVVAGSSDHSVSVWRDAANVGTGTDDKLVLVNGVAIFEPGETFVSCSRDGLVRVWSLADVELLETLPRAHFRSVKGISADAQGGRRRILTGSYDGHAVLWEHGEDGWRWRYLDMHGLPGVPAVKIVDDCLVTGGWDGSLALWDSDGQLTQLLDLTSVVQ